MPPAGWSGWQGGGVLGIPLELHCRGFRRRMTMLINLSDPNRIFTITAVLNEIPRLVSHFTPAVNHRSTSTCFVIAN